MKTAEKLSLVALFLLQSMVIGSALAEQHTAFSGRVRFTPPETWQEMSRDITDTLVRHLYFIPFSPADGTEHSANACLIVRRVPADTDTIYVDRIVYSRDYSGYTVLNDCRDNDNWKSFLWQARTDGAVYVGMERYGVANGIYVSIMLSFPLIGPLADHVNGTQKVLMIDPSYQTGEQVLGVLLFADSCLSIIEEFNSLCESTDIDSTSEFNTRFSLYNPPSKGGQFLRPVQDSGK